MLILAMDTSTMVGGVALIRDGAAVGEHILNVRAAHSERLMSSVAALTAAAGVGPADLGAIACGIGPGSFTGVRIGVSACKAMAYAFSIPMIAVPTLDALAYGRGRGTCAVWCLIDARHGRCYSACYEPPEPRAPQVGALRRVSDYAIRSVDEVVALARESVSASMTAPALFVGDGALAYADPLSAALPGAAAIPPAPLAILRPLQVGLLGMDLLKAGRGTDPETAVPMYLRPSEAEAKLAQGER